MDEFIFFSFFLDHVLRYSSNSIQEVWLQTCLMHPVVQKALGSQNYLAYGSLDLKYMFIMQSN